MINQPSPSCYPNQHSQARLWRLWSFGIILASLMLLCRTPLAQAAAPSNDNYASASLISGATGTTNGTTVEATIEPGEDTYPFAHYASVWYVWTAPADGLYKFTATPATGSVNVSAYAGDSLATASLVAYNNNPIQFSATAGTTYHIAVDGGSGGNQTTFSLAWAPVPPPANDNFANAQTVSGSSGSMGGTTVAATREFFEPNPNLQNSINPATVWYKWTAPATGHFSFDATYTSFGKPTVAVYSGSNLYALSLLATNNYSDSARFDATAGKTYYIQVSDNSSSGDFTLTWALLLPPANDNFGSAQNLDNTGPGTVNASNVAATKEPGEPDHAGNTGGRSVWYKWIAPATGPVRFTTNSSGGFTALLAVYSGSAVNNLSLLGSSSGYYNNAVTILALAGVTYYIAIDGYNSTTPSISGGIGAQEGTFSLSWDVPPTPPVNDNFPNASGTNNAASGTINGNNAGATKETGEPNHGGNPGGKSLWYNWTAPATGRYSFTVQAANPLTSFIIGVYTGNSVNALATVASGSDPYNSGSVVVRFNATAGTTYHIAVDGQNSVGGTPANASEGDFSVTWALLPPPANDNFANATVISTTSGSLNGTTVAATKESGEPNHAGNPGGRSVWYKWVASSTGVAKFAVDKADLLLAVYTGSSVNSLTPVASSASGGPVKFNSVAGTTYYIAVDGADNGSGAAEEAFTLTFSPAPPPPNDNFANAAMISNTNSGSIQGTNVNATKEPGEPNHAGNPGGSSVWYAWTAPATGRYSFDATFSSQPPYSKPLVAVYTGNSINALTPVADNRGLNSSTGGARFQATAGDTYFIAVDGQGDGNVADEGTFTLTWSPATPPANDNFANAAVISNTTSGNIQGTNVNATKEPGEPNHAGNAGGASVWYAWTAPANGRYSFYAYDYPNSIYTYPVAVYTGNSVNALTLVADTSSSSSAVFDATAGATYDIAVDGPSGQGGGVVEKPFVLNWNAVTTTPPTPPANDNFVNSQQLNSTASGYLHSTNEGATKETGEPNHAGNPGGASVWYKWTAPANGRYSFDASADLLVAVYTGSSVNALTLLADNRAAPGARFVAAAGTTYYIAVDGYLSPSSPQYGPFETPFNLSWSPAPPPPNDNFANAAPLSDPSGNVQGTNVAATKEAGEPNHAGNAGGASVWYAWTAPTTGRYSFSVSPDVVYLNPMLLAVYTGSGLNTLTLVADNSLSSVVRFQATAGTTYYIAVDGPYSSGGINGAHESQFALTWSPAKPPANDNFINAQQLGSKDTGSITSDNLNATKETGEPNHAGNAGGASVWYSWIAPNSGRYSFSLPHYGNYGGFKLAVYTGSSVNALTLVADSSASAQARFSATAGTVYYIAVDGFTDSTLPQYGANEGTFTLTWSPAPTPANDNFANAAVINGARGNINGTTINATKEIGEPNHAGNAGGASVWYQWTAPSSGQFGFNASFSTDFNGNPNPALVAVYTGNSVNALTAVSIVSASGEARFTATAGTTYYIAVDGPNNSSGPLEDNFNLSWHSLIPPANDNFANATVISGTTGSVKGTNVDATKEAGEPNHNSNPGGESVWYVWTAPSSGQASFTLKNTSFDAELAVYTGNSVNALTPVAAGEPGRVGDQNLTPVNFNVTAGSTYYIAVDGYSDQNLPTGEGNFTLAWSLSPKLALSISPATFSENAGTNAATATLTRFGDTSGSLTVTLSTSDTNGSAITLPANSISFGPGETTKTFTIGAVDNNTFDGLKVVTITASAPGFLPDTETVDVTDNETPPADAHLFGISYATSNDARDYFANVDDSSGAVTPMSIAADPSQSVDYYSAIDPAHHRYFTVRNGSNQNQNIYQLLSIDTQSGAVTASPSLSQSIYDLQFDQSSRILYAMANKSDGSTDFVTVDPATGTLTKLSTIADNTQNVYGTSVLDAADHEYFTIVAQTGGQQASYNLLAINTQTGAIISSSSIANVVGEMAYDPTTSNLYGLTSNNSGYKLVAVDPATAQITTVGTAITGSPTVTDLSTALDAANHRYFIAIGVQDQKTFKIGYRLIVLNTQTGATISNTALSQSIYNIEYDVVAPIAQPTLTVAVNPASFSEAAGDNAAIGQVTRSGDTSAALTVSLTSSNPKVKVPQSVIIPANAPSVTFQVTTVDNKTVDGDQPVTITANAAGYTAGTFNVTVTDDDKPTLTLSVGTSPATNPTTFSEGAGANAATGTITRNTATDAALQVNVASNRPDKAKPQQAVVTIPAGQTSVSFPIDAVDNAVVDGSQTVTFTASVTGFISGTATAIVTDNDTPQLGLSIAAGPLNEASALTATLTRNTLTDQPLTVNVSSDLSGVVVPSQVTIPAGQSAVNFTISQPDDNIAYGPRTAKITVSKDGFAPASGSVNLTDNDTPALTLTLGAASVVEGGSVTGTVTRNTPPTGDLSVTLASSNAAIPVPAGVTIPAGQMSATFTISTTNDNVAQGDRSTTITTTAGTLTDKKPFTVVDDDGPARLTLSISPTAFPENGSATATVTRNTPTDSALDVTVTTSDANVASVPAKVTIPAGSNFASFSINGVSNHTVDGSHTAVISASGGGLTATPVTVTVTNSDVAPPMPTISSLTPASGPVGTQVTLTGTNLSGATVKFGTLLAVVDAGSSSDTKLVVTVPNDVPMGNTTITITTVNGSTNHTFTVTKLTSFTISGSVLTKVGTAGKPVTGAKVLLLPLKVTGTPTAAAIQDALLDFLAAPATFKPAPVTVDSKGNYSFSKLAAGTYVVAPYKVGTSFKSTTTPGLPYQVVTLSTKNAVNVNFVVSTTETIKPTVTVTQPTNNATFTAAKVPVAKGTVADASGILGVGVVLARLNSVSPSSLDLSLYNWTTNKFDMAFTVTSTTNLLTKVTPAEIKAATVAGSSWTSALPTNLANGNYRVIPFAVDQNFNVAYPLPTGATLLMGNFKVAAATRSLANASDVKLSTASAQTVTSSIQLRFIGALAADSAGDASRYSVSVNGQAATVEAAGYNAATHTVTLSLPEGALRTGDQVIVQWSDLADAQGLPLSGQSGPLTVR